MKRSLKNIAGWGGAIVESVRVRSTYQLETGPQARVLLVFWMEGKRAKFEAIFGNFSLFGPTGKCALTLIISSPKRRPGA